MEEDEPNLISFSENILDENLWKRLLTLGFTSSKGNSTGERMAIEVNMYALVRNFVGHVTSSR